MQEETQYLVVVNDEEQYSIWPACKETLPPGWRAIGVQGDKATCLSRIEELWADMRPLSLRKAMEEAAIQ